MSKATIDQGAQILLSKVREHMKNFQTTTLTTTREGAKYKEIVDALAELGYAVALIDGVTGKDDRITIFISNIDHCENFYFNVFGLAFKFYWREFCFTRRGEDLPEYYKEGVKIKFLSDGYKDPD